MHTKEQIEQIIKSSEAPYWWLTAKQNEYGPSKNVAATVGGQDLTVDQSISLLNQHLDMHKDGLNDHYFEITMQKAKTGVHTDKKIGPFQFTVNSSNNGGAQSPALSGFQGLSGLQQEIQAGMNSLGAIYGQRDQLIVERSALETEKKLLERDREDFKKEVREAQAELKELESKFNSRSEQVKNGASMALEGLLNKYLASGDSPAQGLSGSPEQATEMTPEEEKLQAICNSLFDAFESAPMADLVLLEEKITNLLKEVDNGGV